MKTTCPICGGTAKRVKVPYQTKYNGEFVTIPAVEMYKCSDCGEEFFNAEQSRALSLEVKNTVRQAQGLLSPKRICAIREKLHLTQQELERLLGQGPKVVTRWESGRVIQNRNADTILRMLERDPSTLDHLRKIEQTRGREQNKRERELVAVG